MVQNWPDAELWAGRYRLRRMPRRDAAILLLIGGAILAVVVIGFSAFYLDHYLPLQNAPNAI